VLIRRIRDLLDDRYGSLRRGRFGCPNHRLGRRSAQHKVLQGSRGGPEPQKWAKKAFASPISGDSDADVDSPLGSVKISLRLEQI
jgi:hypothetical protein